MISKLLHSIKRLVLAIVLFILTYLLFAYLLAKISINENAYILEQPITIYIQTNGVHSDVVLPVKNALKDWTKTIEYQHTINADNTCQYLAFGWGDKGFYLQTPTWSELKPSIAFNAAFGLGETAMHTVYIKQIAVDERHIKLTLNAKLYKALVQYVESSFETKKGKVQPINTSVHYSKTDAFYEANYNYSLFKTCNTWTNSALKACGQKACLWTPHQQGIFDKYKF